MMPLSTNLIPDERQRRTTREYYLRLGVVIAWFATGLTLAAGVFLFPTYVFLSSSEHAKQARLATIEASLSSSDEAALSARLKALTGDAAALLALEKAPSVTRLLGEALAVSRPGITLSGFRYSPAKEGSVGMLTLTGAAATREALRGYQLALQSAPWSAKADLPVSAYAKDANIPFSIAVTLKP